jgi:DAK2 domain fusion protein YloV
MAIRTALFVAAAHAALKAQVSRINALNVYPVPDGDTGTNMLLTLEAVLKETSDEAYETPEEASWAGARAALMGARGNSGVILSQMIRGACEVLSRNASWSAETFVAALEGARERAYASLREPVEGTMLTVIKDAAHAARAALKEKEVDLASVAHAAAREAHASVRRTPRLLSTLREAGVVDAGGLGVAVILDGIHACVTGLKVEFPEYDEEESAVPDLDAIHAGEEAWGYCTEFIVTDFDGDARELEDWVHSAGKSVLVVPQADLVKVHLHTQDPGAALSHAGRFGRLMGVKVDDMEAQVRGRSGEKQEAVAFGVVVASRGEGNRRLFEGMGAVVVEGGQGANPSAADFARAVEQTGAPSVVLLPNNKNVVPTVEQVGELVEAETFVVPTTTIVGGLAAMVGFDAEGDPEEVAGEMRDLYESARCAEITRAVRAARIGGREVPEGACIGLVGGELCSVGESVAEVAVGIAAEFLDNGVDIITLLRGEDMGEEEVLEIADLIRGLDGEVEVEIRYGGQPMYPLQMGAE